MDLVTKVKLKIKMNKGKIINILIICGVIFFIYLIHEPVVDMVEKIISKIKELLSTIQKNFFSTYLPPNKTQLQLKQKYQSKIKYYIS